MHPRRQFPVTLVIPELPISTHWVTKQSSSLYVWYPVVYISNLSGELSAKVLLMRWGEKKSQWRSVYTTLSGERSSHPVLHCQFQNNRTIKSPTSVSQEPDRRAFPKLSLLFKSSEVTTGMQEPGVLWRPWSCPEERGQIKTLTSCLPQ